MRIWCSSHRTYIHRKPSFDFHQRTSDAADVEEDAEYADLCKNKGSNSTESCHTHGRSEGIGIASEWGNWRSRGEWSRETRLH